MLGGPNPKKGMMFLRILGPPSVLLSILGLGGTTSLNSVCHFPIYCLDIFLTQPGCQATIKF